MAGATSSVRKAQHRIALHGRPVQGFLEVEALCFDSFPARDVAFGFAHVPHAQDTTPKRLAISADGKGLVRGAHAMSAEIAAGPVPPSTTHVGHVAEMCFSAYEQDDL